MTATNLNTLTLLMLGIIFFGCSKEGSDTNTGTGGSMARFTISDNHLYVVDHNKLHLYDISDLINPKKGEVVHLGFGIETIFPYNNKVFIGTQTGMHIYDIKDPEHPKKLSTYSHIRSCDPVVVQGNHAYVTMRSGTSCRNGSNLLSIVDISDITNPTEIATYPMDNPHGLGINGNNLFVCEGRKGLKHFNASAPLALELKEHLADFDGYDVIPVTKTRIIVTGKTGIYQFEYSDSTNKKLSLLSHIPVAKKEISL